MCMYVYTCKHLSVYLLMKQLEQAVSSSFVRFVYRVCALYPPFCEWNNWNNEFHLLLYDFVNIGSVQEFWSKALLETRWIFVSFHLYCCIHIWLLYVYMHVCTHKTSHFNTKPNKPNINTKHKHNTTTIYIYIYIYT